MIPLRCLLCAICACLAWCTPDLAGAEVSGAPSSSIAHVDLKISGWFSQGETIWSHNASGLDANLGNPSSKLKYKDTGTNVTEITGRVQLKNKIFFRGAFGYGAIGGGRLTHDVNHALTTRNRRTHVASERGCSAHRAGAAHDAARKVTCLRVFSMDSRSRRRDA